MKDKSRVLTLFLSALFISFLISSSANGAANVSRSADWRTWSPRIVVDSAGNLHVVYVEYYTSHRDNPPGTGDAYYCKYDITTEQWSNPLNLSNSGTVYSVEYRPVGIAIDGSDKLYVVYQQNTQVFLRIFSDGAWGNPFEVATSNDQCDSLRIAVDNSENIFICWWTVNRGVVYSRARVGGTWEDVRTLSLAGKRSKFPDIAVGPNFVGCAWQGKEDVYRTKYAQRGKSLNDSWSQPQTVAASGPGQEVPALEIDSSDAVHVVYTTNITSTGVRIVYYAKKTGNNFSTPIALSTQNVLHYPSIHKRGGNLYVAWQNGSWGNGKEVRFNKYSNGSWSGQTPVPESSDCTYTDVATSPSQDTIYFVWDAYYDIWCNMGATGPPPPPPGNPVANFDFSPSGGPPPLEVTFDASASYDTDGGTIESYSWNFGDGSTGSGQIVTHTYINAGTYSVKLTVTDNDQKTGSRTKTLEVIANNELPIVDFTFSPNTGLYPLKVTFTSTSYDPDGTIADHSWNFGDGGRGSGRVVEHTYTRAGIFTVRLTVTDDRGATASKSKNIEVLSVFPPLNVNWETHADESLFQSRYVTEVTWEKNPRNDELGIQIALYLIYRKKKEDPRSAYKYFGQVSGDVYRFLDKDVGGKDLYTYGVSAVDSEGHESRLSESGDVLNLLKSLRESQLQNKRSNMNKRL